MQVTRKLTKINVIIQTWHICYFISKSLGCILQFISTATFSSSQVRGCNREGEDRVNDCDYLHDGGESKIEDGRCIQILFSQPMLCAYCRSCFPRSQSISNTLCTNNVPVVCSALIDLSHIRNAKFETTKSFLSVFSNWARVHKVIWYMMYQWNILVSITKRNEKQQTNYIVTSKLEIIPSSQLKAELEPKKVPRRKV